MTDPNVEVEPIIPEQAAPVEVEPMISSAEAEIVPEQAAPVEAEPMTDPNVEVEPIISAQAAPVKAEPVDAAPEIDVAEPAELIPTAPKVEEAEAEITSAETAPAAADVPPLVMSPLVMSPSGEDNPTNPEAVEEAGTPVEPISGELGLAEPAAPETEVGRAPSEPVADSEILTVDVLSKTAANQLSADADVEAAMKVQKAKEEEETWKHMDSNAQHADADPVLDVSGTATDEPRHEPSMTDELRHDVSSSTGLDAPAIMYESEQQNSETEHFEPPAAQHFEPEPEHFEPPAAQHFEPEPEHFEPPAAQHFEPEPEHFEPPAAQHFEPEPEHFEPPAAQHFEPEHFESPAAQQFEPEPFAPPAAQHFEPEHFAPPAAQQFEPEPFAPPAAQRFETAHFASPATPPLVPGAGHNLEAKAAWWDSGAAARPATPVDNFRPPPPHEPAVQAITPSKPSRLALAMSAPQKNHISNFFVLGAFGCMATIGIIIRFRRRECSAMLDHIDAQGGTGKVPGKSDEDAINGASGDADWGWDADDLESASTSTAASRAPPGQSAAQKSLQLKGMGRKRNVSNGTSVLGSTRERGRGGSGDTAPETPGSLPRPGGNDAVGSPAPTAAASAMSPGPARPSPSTDFFAELGMDSRPSAVSFKQSNKSSSSFGRPASSSSKLGAAAISSGAAAWDDVDDLDI